MTLIPISSFGQHTVAEHCAISNYSVSMQQNAQHFFSYTSKQLYNTHVNLPDSDLEPHNMQSLGGS